LRTLSRIEVKRMSEKAGSSLSRLAAGLPYTLVLLLAPSAWAQMGGMRPGMGGMGPGMLRAIAYGTELNMAYPPRPTDPAVAWEPDWNVKIRVKSMTTAMMGMEGSGMPGMGGGTGEEEMTDAPAPANGQAEPATEEPKKKRKFNPLDVVKDVVKSPVP